MKDLEKRIRQHLEERGWDNLRPSDIAKSIMIEGGELLELFQWENRELEDIKKDIEKVEGIKKELADVLIYALDMAVLLELDTTDIINKKLDHVAKNLVISGKRNQEELKYPYGYKAKERFQLRGQLFKGKEVRLVWFV